MIRDRLKWIAPGMALAALLLMLAFAGPLALDPTASANSGAAQTPVSSATTSSRATPADNLKVCALRSGSQVGPGGSPSAAVDDLSNAVWQAAAMKLGTSVDQLQQDLSPGKSLADLAQARHLTLQQVEDAMRQAGQAELQAAVQHGTLTQAQADQLSQELLGALVTKMARTPGPAEDGSGKQAMSGPEQEAQSAVSDAMWNAAASTLGIAPDQLRSDLNAGQSIADLAAAHQVTVQQVHDAMVSAGRAAVATRLASGALTQTQADDLGHNYVTGIAMKVTTVRPSTSAGTSGATVCGSKP